MYWLKAIANEGFMVFLIRCRKMAAKYSEIVHYLLLPNPTYSILPLQLTLYNLQSWYSVFK
jgi:hypothetical protein